MKRILTLVLTLSLFVPSFAGTNVVIPKKSPGLNANEVWIPIGKNGEMISLMDLTLLKAKEFETLTGKKLSMTEKLGFKVAQKKLRSSIGINGEINKKTFEKAVKEIKKADGKEGQYLKLWLILLGAAIVFSILSLVSHVFWWIAYLAGIGAAVFFVLWIIEKAGGM